MTETALFTSPMARKKQVHGRYNPNTYRVLSHEAENIAFDRPSVSSPIKLPNTSILGQHTDKSLLEFRHNRPNPRDVGFLRQDVALLNEPICDVKTSSTRHEQQHWWPSHAAEKIKPTAPFKLDTTIRNDFQWRGQDIIRTTRHSSNPNTKPAFGSVPVNFLRQPSGEQRLWKEGISYEHQFNCRNEPSYPIRGKRHGSFVWDEVSPQERGELLKMYGYSNNQQELATNKLPVTKNTEVRKGSLGSPKLDVNPVDAASIVEPVISDQSCTDMPPVEN